MIEDSQQLKYLIDMVKDHLQITSAIQYFCENWSDDYGWILMAQRHQKTKSAVKISISHFWIFLQFLWLRYIVPCCEPIKK